MLDVACFLGLGQVFAEIMTGNLVYLAFGIGTNGTAANVPVLPYVIALGTFAIPRRRCQSDPERLSVMSAVC